MIVHTSTHQPEQFPRELGWVLDLNRGILPIIGSGGLQEHNALLCEHPKPSQYAESIAHTLLMEVCRTGQQHEWFCTMPQLITT